MTKSRQTKAIFHSRERKDRWAEILSKWSTSLLLTIAMPEKTSKVKMTRNVPTF